MNEFDYPMKYPPYSLLIHAETPYAQPIDADTNAFNHVLEAYKMPKENENQVSMRNKKIDNAINTIESIKVPLNTKIDSKPEILLIVDKGMSRIPEGPPKDSEIKSIDRHKGHNH